MGTSVGVGSSVMRDPSQAGREAAWKAVQQAGVTRPDFVFVFATVGYHQQTLITAIREATGGAPLSGCSAEGIITQQSVDETNFAVCVMVLSSDEIRFQNTRTREIGRRAALAGERLGAAVKPLVTPDCIACVLLADGLVFHFDPFLAAFEAALGPPPLPPLFGALAADNWTTKKTYQYHDDEVFSEGISCVVMSGKGKVAYGINHGCMPVGTRRTVTASRGNVIYELDGVPVMKVLEDFFEEEWMSQWNKMTLNLCLGFKTPQHMSDGYEEYVTRYMMGKNDREGYVTVQSDVAQGSELWILRRDKELITGGMRSIARTIRETVAQREAKFVMHFECMARGKAVFREKEKIELVRTLQRQVGPNIPWIGFYSYGEIAPVGGYNCFHNFTAVVTAFY